MIEFFAYKWNISRKYLLRISFLFICVIAVRHSWIDKKCTWLRFNVTDNLSLVTRPELCAYTRVRKQSHDKRARTRELGEFSERVIGFTVSLGGADGETVFYSFFHLDSCSRSCLSGLPFGRRRGRQIDALEMESNLRMLNGEEVFAMFEPLEFWFPTVQIFWGELHSFVQWLLFHSSWNNFSLVWSEFFYAGRAVWLN